MENDVNSAKKYIERFESFLNSTEEARQNSENCRDYYDHKQWSSEEINVLKGRGQAPIVNNRIKPKVDALKGLVVNQRTDPKAYPVTQKHEQGSFAITDALRYVNDNTDFDSIEESVAENVFIEGTGAAIVEIKNTTKGPEIEIAHIPWDRYYYDPHARRLDLSDKKFDGIVIWADLDDAISWFPDHEEALTNLVQSYNSVTTETYDDKPLWIDRKRKRVRICQEYCLEGGVWREVFFTWDLTLKSGDSPYLDEEGNPTNPIESCSAYVDRNLSRYGPVHVWLDLQDEINHRRSKALYLLSVRQTSSRRGAIENIDKMKKELAKPNGHVEYNGEKGDFDVLPTGDMAQAQFALLEEAKGELDSQSLNAQLSGERQNAISGVAVQSLQSAGMLELSPTLAELKRWKRRVFRQVWFRIKQFWNEEKWIRITDSYDTIKWTGLNYKITAGELLKERAEDESLPPDVRQQAAQTLQIGMEIQDPRLMQIVETRNEVAELDVDIILDVQPDSLTIQEEQFQLLLQLAASRPEVPFSALLKMSRIREKDAIIEEMEQSAQMAMQIQQLQAQLEAQDKQAAAQLKQAQAANQMSQAQERGLGSQINAAEAGSKIRKTEAEATQKEIENVILVTEPERVTNVAI